MVFDIAILTILIVFSVCVVCGKPINITITHVHKVEQPTMEPVQQLTDDELKAQQQYSGLVETLQTFMNGGPEDA